MLNKKRKKSSRYKGRHTAGRGGKKKARGSGHRGGFGMAGTGKRADQKKTLVLNYEKEYFGKQGLKAKAKRYEIINVGDIEKIANGKEADLKNYKILGNGEIKTAMTIHAFSASKSAIEKIEKAGGKIIIAHKEKNADKEAGEETPKKVIKAKKEKTEKAKEKK